MPDRVHPAMHDVQSPAFEPVPDGAASGAQPKQLGPRDDAVLALGKIGDRPIDATLGSYDGLNVERIAHALDAGVEFVPVERRSAPLPRQFDVGRHQPR